MMSTSARPTCPKCDCSRVNRIGHAQLPSGKDFLFGALLQPDPAAPLEFRFYCERCGHAWRAGSAPVR